MQEVDQLKILIVDDESSLRTLLKAIFLSENSYQIMEAADGNEAIELINKNKPHVIILDVMMPGQSGFEVCEKIKKNPDLKDIITIILTAKGQETDKEWAKSVGADYFLSKPFSPIDLLELVQSLHGNAAKT
jgi:CheY-like chemotaxis protein